MQLALCFALGIPFLLAGVVAMVAGAGPTLIALGFALIAWQAQEFLRRVLYFEGRSHGSLSSSTSSATVVNSPPSLLWLLSGR